MIFKHELSNSLDKYANLLNKYTRLIFSNYDDWKICIKTNTEFDIDLDNLIGLKFNKPLKLNQNFTYLSLVKILINQFNCVIAFNEEIG